MDEPRILTDDETRRRRAEQASGAPGGAVSLCAWQGCNQLADHGPLCRDHHRRIVPLEAVATLELTDTELEQVKADVDAKAAPLFLLAMDWIVRGQLAQLGVPQLEGPISISSELGGGDAA